MPPLGVRETKPAPTRRPAVEWAWELQPEAANWEGPLAWERLKGQGARRAQDRASCSYSRGWERLALLVQDPHALCPSFPIWGKV